MNDLQIYRGDPLKLNDHLIVHQPTLGEIADYGEERYFQLVQTLCATPSDYMLALNEMGIDFEEIDEFSLFILLHGSLKPEDTSILFGDLDLTSYEIMTDQGDNCVVLYCPISESIIDMAIYTQMIDFIRRTHNMPKNTIKAMNAEAKRYILEREHRRLRRRQKNCFISVLQPLISAMVNHEGFKFNTETVWQMRIYAFHDCVKRVLKIKEAQSLLSGIYAGTVDAKKLPQGSLDWIGSLQ